MNEGLHEKPGHKNHFECRIVKFSVFAKFVSSVNNTPGARMSETRKYGKMLYCQILFVIRELMGYSSACVRSAARICQSRQDITKCFQVSLIFKIRKALPVFLLVLCSMPVWGLAETGVTFLEHDSENALWHIRADQIEYDQEKDQYIAEGNIIVSKEDKKISADFVRFDHRNMLLFAEGHVMMSTGEDRLTGSSMSIDLNNETGTIRDADIFLRESNFYIKGHEIRKTGKNAYTAYNASISSCDGTAPAWKITGKNLDVTIEGYGFVKHAALWAKNIPVFYTPFFVFPVKMKRQSGLLLPEMGRSGRKGMEYNQPFYWAITDSSDATFYLNYMEKRGTKTGIEYRYVQDSSSGGTLMFDFLRDRKSDDGTSASSEKWGYTDDVAFRPNTDRYWFRMKHDQSLPAGLTAKLDIDVVSDQDYLHEFKNGHNGFERTEAFFNKKFGRELDDYNDPTRVSRFSLNKKWENYSFNAEARWYDNVIARRQKDRDPTLQKLPFVRLDSLKHQIPATPFYWKLNSEYTYFYRKDGTRGHRADVHPRVYLPYRLKNYFTVEPSVGFRETLWYIDTYEDTFSEKDRHFDRGMYDMKLELHSNLFRVFSLRQKTAEKLRHNIKPGITYEYVSHQEQNEHPFFDFQDQIEKKNLLTYSLTNILTAKSEQGYRQFCRLRLEQSYDIAEANEGDPAEWKNGKEKQPFSPIYAEIELDMLSFASLTADAGWSVYENEFETRNIAVNITDHRGDRLFVEHRYAKNSRESLYADISVKLSDRLTLYADYELNLRDDREIKNGMGFFYSTGCWSAEFRHTNEADDRKYAFMLNLYGLGGIGGDK